VTKSFLLPPVVLSGHGRTHSVWFCQHFSTLTWVSHLVTQLLISASIVIPYLLQTYFQTRWNFFLAMLYLVALCWAQLLLGLVTCLQTCIPCDGITNHAGELSLHPLVLTCTKFIHYVCLYKKVYACMG